MHTTRQVQAFVTELVYRIDVDTLHREQVATLGLNDIGRVQLTTSQPLCFDPYAQNHATGSFILVDPHTHVTVGAGMIRGPSKQPPASIERAVSSDVVWQDANIARPERDPQRPSRRGVWFTRLSGAGRPPSRGRWARLFSRAADRQLDGTRSGTGW
jgi:bifunctional enzyme CysN/CysC